MEQSNQVQSLVQASTGSKTSVQDVSVESLQESVAASQVAPDKIPLEWNEESMDYSFKDGAYTCEYVEGSFMSLTSLKKAWREKLSKEKLAQAQKNLLHARDPRSEMTPAARKVAVNKAMKDKKKWATP